MLPRSFQVWIYHSYIRILYGNIFRNEPFTHTQKELKPPTNASLFARRIQRIYTFSIFCRFYYALLLCWLSSLLRTFYYMVLLLLLLLLDAISSGRILNIQAAPPPKRQCGMKQNRRIFCIQCCAAAQNRASADHRIHITTGVFCCFCINSKIIKARLRSTLEYIPKLNRRQHGCSNARVCVWVSGVLAARRTRTLCWSGCRISQPVSNFTFSRKHHHIERACVRRRGRRPPLSRTFYSIRVRVCLHFLC